MRDLYKALALTAALPLVGCRDVPQNTLEVPPAEKSAGQAAIAYVLGCSSGEGDAAPTFTCYFREPVGAELCGTQHFSQANDLIATPAIKRRDRTLAFLLTQKEKGLPV